MNSEQNDLDARLRRSFAAGDAAPELSPAVVAEAPHRRAPRLVNHGRVLQASGGAAIAVAAVTAGSLVIAAPWQSRAPLFTAAASSGEQSAFGAAASGAESGDMRIGLWQPYEYLPGDGLSRDGGSGRVYALERSGTAEQALTELADVFAIDGEPRRTAYYDEAYPSYVIGSEDGTAPSLTITWAGTGNWWFSDPAASGTWVCGSAPGDGATGSDGSTGDDPITIDPAPETCVEPAPPADGVMPSDDEARSHARDIFAATGLEVAAGDIRITADDWQTVATANLMVDGVRTAVDWSVAWGSSGEIAWAYGHAIDVVDKGEYGTVSERDAVSRLTDGRWFGAAGPDYQGEMRIMAAEGGAARDSGVVTTEPGMPGDGSTDGAVDPGAPADPVTEPAPEPQPSEPAPAPEPTVEPAPVGTVDTEAPVEAPVVVEPTVEPIPEPLPDPMPTIIEPEVITVTLEEAEATLLLMWDSEGNAWLVPGYAYPQPEGWWNSVVSLVEGVIALPEPIEVDKLPVEIEPLPAPADE